jgi:lipopolysaccharide biosynthesis regulator YciM
MRSPHLPQNMSAVLSDVRSVLHRQMCSLEFAKSDFESVIKLKPNHSTAAKELSSLTDLQSAFQQLQQLQEAHAGASAAGGPLPDVSSARQVLDKVYSLAPDCAPAQLMDAQLEMLQGNYEQVGSSALLLAYDDCFCHKRQAYSHGRYRQKQQGELICMVVR